MSKVFFIFLITLSFFNLSHARKPAVDPVIGISIEEYKQVPPSKAKGFNFRQTSSTTSRIHSTEDLKQDTATDTNGAENFLIIFLVFLPIIATGMTFYLMKKDIVVDNNSNVIDIFSNKKDTTEDNFDDHDDLPKAS